MDIRPLEDRIVVRPIKGEQVTDTGLVIPEGDRKENTRALERGTVIAVGQGRKEVSNDGILYYRDMEVKVGDVVLYPPYAGADITKFDGVETFIMSEEEVVAVER